MKFNLEELNPGTWFPFEGDARACVRACAGDDLREIRRQCVKRKVEYRNGQRLVYEEIDEDLQSQLLWDFCIIGWEGFVDQNGKDIPCNSEFKKILMGKSIKFSAFIGECMEKINALNKIQAEEAAKN